MTNGLLSTLHRAVLRMSVVIVAGVSAVAVSASVSDSPALAEEPLREGYTESGSSVVEGCPEEYLALTDGECVVDDTLEVSEERVASPAEIAEVADVTNADGVRLGDVAQSATIYYVNWTQTLTDSLGWFRVHHKGTAYYDKNGRVWSTSGQSGYTGYHSCHTNWAVGVTISEDDCYTEVRHDLSSAAISEWYFFTVSAPIGDWAGSWGLNIHVNIYQSGTVDRYTCGLC